MRTTWKRRRAAADHTDDWLMTYADMITLLLCFFAIFLSVSVPKDKIPPQAQVTVPVIEQQKEPDYLEGNLPFHGKAFADGPTGDSVDVPVERVTEAVKPLPPVIIDPPTLPPDFAVVETVTAPAVPEAPPITSLPEIVNRAKQAGPAELKEKGDRITTLEMNSAAFFESGSASLSKSGMGILQDVAVNLKSEKFRGYRVTVEGHTDDAPIHTAQFPSNWELSTARASAVVHFFLQQGIPAQRLRAAGYADTFPLVPNRDGNGKPIAENQARNRRVIIKLEKIEKDE